MTVQAPHYVPAQRGACVSADILGLTALATHVQGGDGKSLCNPDKFVEPVACAPGVAVELQDGGVGTVDAGPEVLGVDPGAPHTGKPEVEALGKASRVGSIRQFDARLYSTQVGQSSNPVIIEVQRLWVATLVRAQLLERHLKERHRWPPELTHHYERSLCPASIVVGGVLPHQAETPKVQKVRRQQAKSNQHSNLQGMKRAQKGGHRSEPRPRIGHHPTILDVARAAGVSKSTVSNVMHRSGRFTAETESQVLDAIQKLGFRPNVLARQLVQQRTTTLGVMVGALDNPFYAEMAMQIERESAAHGFHTMFCNTYGDAPAEIWALESYLDYRVAGILFVSNPSEPKRARQLIERRVPTVFVTCESEWGDVVRCDDEEGGLMATQHLVSLGHRRIAYFSDPIDDAANQDRQRGYAKVMRKAALQSSVVRWDRKSAGVADTTVSETVRHGATAIFTTDDYGAIELVDAADRLGINIPRQLSVIGFDDLIMSGLGRIGLTTIRQPKMRLAQVAVSALVDRIKGQVKGPPVRHVVPVELIVRGSTAKANG